MSTWDKQNQQNIFYLHAGMRRSACRTKEGSSSAKPTIQSKGERIELCRMTLDDACYYVARAIDGLSLSRSPTRSLYLACDSRLCNEWCRCYINMLLSLCWSHGRVCDRTTMTERETEIKENRWSEMCKALIIFTVKHAVYVKHQHKPYKTTMVTMVTNYYSYLCCTYIHL